MNRFQSILALLFISYVLFLCVGAQLEYTEKEKQALEKFREKVRDVTYNDYMTTDAYLIRWLRARNLDLTQAGEMLRMAIRWRKENKIDGILNEKIFDLPSPPFYADGVDYEGSQIVTMLPARVDMRKYVLNGRRGDTVRYWDQLCEQMELASTMLLELMGNATANDAIKLIGPLSTIEILRITGYVAGADALKRVDDSGATEELLKLIGHSTSKELLKLEANSTVIKAAKEKGVSDEDIKEITDLLRNLTETKRKRPEVVTVVMDLHGYSLRQHGCIACLSTYIEWFIHVEAYYPGYAKHFIMINAPRIAIPMIELLKPVMSTATRNALQVFAADKNEWLPVLNKIFSPDQVRSNLGGTKLN